jgi:hypothetical protein
MRLLAMSMTAFVTAFHFWEKSRGAVSVVGHATREHEPAGASRKSRAIFSWYEMLFFAMSKPSRLEELPLRLFVYV